MRKQVFECESDGFMLLSKDEYHMSDGHWVQLDRIGWSPVGFDARYNVKPKSPLRLYGEKGADGKVIPIGRFVDHTDTPHYRPLTDGERKKLGLEVVQAEKSPTDKHLTPKRDMQVLAVLAAGRLNMVGRLTQDPDRLNTSLINEGLDRKRAIREALDDYDALYIIDADYPLKEQGK